MEENMVHKDVYAKFARLFSDLASQAELYFPNGKNCIRVRVVGGKEFIFTYHSDKDYILETVDRFVKRLKGEK
jgi:hypothetical protein